MQWAFWGSTQWNGLHLVQEQCMLGTCQNEYRNKVTCDQSIVIRGLSTGIYATNSPEACHYILENCKANIVVVENQKQLDKILEVSYNGP